MAHKKHKRTYNLISEIEKWTLPFFKASSGFCPLYSPSIFSSTAALSHGLNLSQERKYRTLIIRYMFEAGDNLLLPYNTVCIAITYFHKFFQSISIRAHDPYFISTSCLFTAGKQEETRVRLDKCARFLYDYKLRFNAKNTNSNKNKYEQPSKSEIERICKKLAIAELLCTQINKFYYNINLPFDYLLPIICEWKSVYIPHQTNSHTLKHCYALHAFRFIRESYYTPLNIVVPPQKVAISAMELSLRLNYTKYITQSNTVNESDASEYRYIDPPLEWFRIFDIDSNAQDLRDEIDLICNEIVDGIQDLSQFGIGDRHCLRQWRKGTLKTDKVHIQLLEQQTKHSKQEFVNEVSDGALIEYPYNCSNEVSVNALLNSMGSIDKKHRYSVQKRAELALAFNNQSISPATLNPHKFYALYPIKNECFSDVDREYSKEKEREMELELRERKRTKHKSHSKKSQSRKKRREKRVSSSEESSDEDMDSHSHSHSRSGSDNEENKSNALHKSQSKRERNRKRKRSETDTHKNRRKKRRIQRHKSHKDKSDNNSEDETSDSDHSHSHSHSRARDKRRSKSKSKSQSRSKSSSSSRERETHKKSHKKRDRHSHSHRSKRERQSKRSRSPSNNRNRVRKAKKSHNRYRDRDRDRYNNNTHIRGGNDGNGNGNGNKRNKIMHRFSGGYFTPAKGGMNKRGRAHNSNSNSHRRGGHNNSQRRGANMAMNGYYGYNNSNNNDQRETVQSFDYGLTPNTNNKNRMEMNENSEAQLRQMLTTFNSGNEREEHKTQRNDEKEPVSPLLKALRNKKSALYTNMGIVIRKDQ